MGQWIIILLLGLGFAIGNLYKFSFLSPEVKVSILDCVIILFTILNFKFYIKIPRQLFQPIVLFSLVAGASLFLAYLRNGQTTTFIGSMYLVRWVIYSLFFLSLIRLFKAQGLKQLALILGMLVVLIGLVQYIIWPDMRGLEILEWDPHYYRVVGSWLDPGFTGLLLVFTLVFIQLNPLKNKTRHWLLSAFTYLAMALTYSRSSYLAFLAAMGVISIKRKNWQFFAKSAVLLLATLIILPRSSDGEGVKLERTNSVQARIDSWRQAISIWETSPVLGVGFNTYRYASGASLSSHAGAGADSSLLFVAATSGFLGLGAYLWYLKKLYLLNSMKFYLIPLLVHSLFLNSLFYPAVLLWLAIITAIDLKSR